MYVLYDLGIFLPVRVRFENTDSNVSHACCVRLGRTVYEVLVYI